MNIKFEPNIAVEEVPAERAEINKLEATIGQVMSDWNNIKRCLTLSQNYPQEQERVKYELEMYQSILCCELRLRSLQRSIRGLSN